MAILKIRVAKAKGKFVEVDDSLITSDAMFSAIFQAGLEVFINAKMSKVGAVTKLEGEELEKAEAKAMEIAEANLAEIYAGTLPKKGRSAKSDGKVPGVVMTEARRLAKEVIKNQIRAEGKKISHVEPKLITALANEMLANDTGEGEDSFIAKARANLEERSKITPKIDLSKLVESPKLVAKADAEKAARKATTSAAKARKPAAPRKAKPVQPEAH